MAIDRLGDIGSDQFPMFFKLCLTERASERKVAPAAAAATEVEASKQVAESKEEKREEDRGE